MIYMKTVDFLDADYCSLFQVNCFVYIAYWSQNGTFSSATCKKGDYEKHTLQQEY